MKKNINFLIITLALIILTFSVLAQEKKENAAKLIEMIITENGLEEAITKFDEILSNRDHYILNESELNTLGYRYASQHKYNEAISVLKMNVKAFPDSWNVYDSLGEIYSWIKYNDQAIENLNKSLEINPNNENAIKNLSQVNGNISDHKNQTRLKFKYKYGEKTGIQGPYLGEEPPGVKPKLFAPGIISTYNHFELSFTFTPDGKEFYFTRRADEEGINVIMVCKWQEDGWTAPDTASFSMESWNCEPYITPDGKKLYFNTNRIKPGEVWVMEKIGDKWSTPKFALDGMYVSSTYDGSIYYTDIKTVGGIVKTQNKNGEFQHPVKQDGGVNNPTDGVHPFISPDEKFILFDSQRKEGFGGEGDLYVAFKDSSGKWGEAYNLGELVNGPGIDFCASISPDGKYIFYTKNRDIYCVSAKIIEQLKPKNLK